MEKLRKVLFTLNEENLTLGDVDFKDSEGILKERHGFFHCWGNVSFYDSEEGKFKFNTVAIVEESGTGKVFEVAPICIQFETPMG